MMSLVAVLIVAAEVPHDEFSCSNGSSSIGVT